MGEYVININWGGGNGGSKTNTYQKGTSLLPAAVLVGTFNQNSITPDTFMDLVIFKVEMAKKQENGKNTTRSGFKSSSSFLLK